MAGKEKTLVITIEYRLAVPDEKIANFMADLAELHGAMLGSENYGIWDWNPIEKVISTSVE